jgi:eukaryotic-like serine/threonine-protein kinase
MSFLSELRQKRIVQIILTYLAIGWVVLQVADQLSNRGVIPDISYSVVLILVLFGAIAAALIGWNHGEKGDQKAPRSEIIALFVLAILALGSSGFVVRKDMVAGRVRAAAEHPLELQKIAVMYFKDYTDDPQLSYVADGLTEDLVRTLRGVGSLDVLSKNATAQFRGQDPALDSVALLLDVGTVVDGSVEKRGDDIEVTIQLVDGKSGAVVQRSKIKRPAGEMLAMRDSVVEQAANLLREWIGKEVRLRSSERGTEVREAWALVQRAENSRKAAEAAVHDGGPDSGEPKFNEAINYLDQARKLDGEWVEPLIQKTAITYRRSRLSYGAGQPERAARQIEEGLQYAEESLKTAANEPRALELRGTLRYFKWLLNLTPDADQRAQLLAGARKDLEDAVQLDPGLAAAHSTLSHLLYNQEDIASAVVEARTAYEKDAYLESANEIVFRLFYGNFDLENLTQAKDWCQKGKARFPQDYRFTFCELRLMATPAVEPDPAKAWALFAQMDSLVPAPRKTLEHIRAEMTVGGVLARASMRDSAAAVLNRAHAELNPQIDPSYDLTSYEAAMRLLLGDKQGAFDLLRRVVLANPDQGFPRGRPLEWFFRDLQNHPDIGQLYRR